MPLSVTSFKRAATGFKSHKEQHGSTIDPAMLLSKPEIDDLMEQYASKLDPDLIQQVVVVRKGHRQFVTDMLHNLVQFREQQGWPCRIDAEDLNPLVVASDAHVLETNYSLLPTVRITYHKVDPAVASPKDFQLQAQYAIQEASKLHPKGEIALVMDFAETSFGVLTQMNSGDLSRGMNIFQLYPVKVKRVYVENTSLPIRLVIKAVLSLTSSAIRNRVVFV